MPAYPRTGRTHQPKLLSVQCNTLPRVALLGFAASICVRASQAAAEAAAAAPSICQEGRDTCFLDDDSEDADVSFLQLRLETVASDPDPYAVYKGQHLLKVKRQYDDAKVLLTPRSGVASRSPLKGWFAARNCSFVSGEERLDSQPSHSASAGATTHSTHDALVACSAAAANAASEMAAHSIGKSGDGDKLPPFGIELMSRDAAEALRDAGSVNVFRGSDESIHEQAPSLDFYRHYRSLADIEARLQNIVQQLADANTSVTASIVAPQPLSHEGRQIVGLRLRGAGWSPGKGRMVIIAQMHAREWIAGMVGMYIAEHLVRHAVNNSTSFTDMEIVVIPVSNPDGFEHSRLSQRFWRKNKNPNSNSNNAVCTGVDLNRNFDMDWHPTDMITPTCDMMYSGVSAFSEPETQAIRAVIEEAPTTLTLDLHSYGELIAGPWSYTNDQHPRGEEIGRLGRQLRDNINAVNNETYYYGTGDIDGLLYTASGTLMDWASLRNGTGMLIELRGDDFVLPSSQIVPTAREIFEGGILQTLMPWLASN